MLAQENSSIFTYILLLLLLLFCDYCFSCALLLFFPFFNIYLFFILFFWLIFLLCVCVFLIIKKLKCFSFVKCMNFCKSHTFWFIFHFEFFREIIEKKFIVSSIFLTYIEVNEVKRFLMDFFSLKYSWFTLLLKCFFLLDVRNSL